ncbi:hypothetical protein BYT27DRAFT_6837253 [Phlegmacium glaucopus]|nr:hypothetical protein BYT27DRAFT_6837253 [Phlegmacium glaucopus]
MPPCRTLDAFLDQGEQRGGRDESGTINNKEVRKALQSGTERNYSCAVALYGVYTRRMPGADLNSFETPKDPMPMQSTADTATLRQYWKNLTTSWRRAGRQEIKDEVVLSTSNFIKGPLQNKMSLAPQKRARRFGTMLHFVYLGTQLWKYD